MTYTDKSLIYDISNKAFKRKYRMKNQISYSKDYSRRLKKSLGLEKINKTTWMQRILRKNPWLKEPEPIFDSLQPEDQAHLDSIKADNVKQSG